MEDVGDCTEASLICRACLCIVEYKAQSFGYIEDPNGSLRDMIMCCVPEMDIYVSSDPIMCLPCIQFIISLYNFKNRCINTENIIRSYLQRNNLEEYNHVNLNCVVNELIQINKIQKEQQEHILAKRIAMETVNESSVHPHLLVSNFGSLTGNSIPFPTQPISALIKSEKGNDSSTGEVENTDHSQDQTSFTTDSVQKNEAMLQQSNISSSKEFKNRESNRVVEKLNNAKDSINSIECKLRLVVRIPRSQITIPLEKSNCLEDKNEDSSEKENSQKEIGIPELNHRQEEEGDSTNKSILKYDINRIYNCSCMYLTTSAVLFQEHKKKCKHRNNNLLKCPHCTHVTNRPYALSKHVNAVHTKATWYQCDFCAYRTTTKECLRRHSRKNHTTEEDDESANTCQVCGQMCSTKLNLSRHMLKHSSSLLSCDFCSYTSKDRSNFRKHIFTHNVNPLACHLCGYTNVSPYQMRIHLKQRHGGVGVETVDCRSDRPVSEIINDIKLALMEEKGIMGGVV